MPDRFDTNPQDSLAATLMVLAASLLISCVVARLAGGGRASAAWGLLGPVGWIVAALRSIQVQLDELPPPPTAAASRPAVSVHPTDGVRMQCPSCLEKVTVSSAADGDVVCPECLQIFRPAPSIGGDSLAARKRLLADAGRAKMVTCTGCGQSKRLPAVWTGTTIECGNCHVDIPVPL